MASTLRQFVLKVKTMLLSEHIVLFALYVHSIGNNNFVW